MIQDGQTVRLAFENSGVGSGIFTDTGISVTVKLDYGNGSVVAETVTTENFTALGCLEALVGYDNLELVDYGSFGILVNGINNITTGSTVDGLDDTSNHYWMWYINDGWATVGASAYVCQQDDVVEFKFEESAWV